MTHPEVRDLDVRPEVFPLSVPATTASALLMGRRVRLHGWSFRETTAAAGASLRLHNGSDSVSQLVVVINLNSNESIRDTTDSLGVLCRAGVFLDILAGSVEGAVWVEYV